MCTKYFKSPQKDLNSIRCFFITYMEMFYLEDKLDISLKRLSLFLMKKILSGNVKVQSNVI